MHLLSVAKAYRLLPSPLNTGMKATFQGIKNMDISTPAPTRKTAAMIIQKANFELYHR